MKRPRNRRNGERALGPANSMVPLWALLVACAVLPGLLVGGASWINYRSALANASRELQRVAEVGREHAASTFAIQDRLTERINDLLRDRPAGSIAPGDPALHDTLASMIGHVPQAQTVLLADSDGRAVASAAVFPLMAHASVAKRDYFQHVVVEHEAGPYISALQMSDVSHILFFGLAQPWLDAAGKLCGVIDVAIPAAFFTDFYRFMVDETPESEEGSMVMLLRPAGDILARYPQTIQPGALDKPSALFRQAVARAPQAGTYAGRVDNLPGDPSYLFAYSKVENYPVYVVAGRRRSAIVAAFRQTLVGHVVFGLLATIALVAMSLTALARTRREHFAFALAKREMARRKRAETALLRAQRLEAVGQMTSGVAHDFNNLLTLIMGSAELLERRAADPARVRALAGHIVQASRRGGVITQQLLSFSRRQFMSPHGVELGRFLAEFRPMLERTAGAGLTVTLDMAAEKLNVRIDSAHFETALLNLVANSRDAMAVPGTLVIGAHPVTLATHDRNDLPAGRYVRVTVSDTGAGMDSDTLAKAFEPFFTTKGAGKGTGLGLSQVYGFAKQSDGDAQITSAIGFGTHVSLLLPCVRQEAAEHGRIPGDRPAEACSGHAHDPRHGQDPWRAGHPGSDAP